MAPLLLPLLLLGQGAAAWDLWQPTACGKCGDVPIEELLAAAQARDKSPGPPAFAAGCMDEVAEVPHCNVSAAGPSVQAGGHLGTFQTLAGGRVAKLCTAFDTAETKRLKELRARAAAMTEYGFYMQLWCLREMRAANRSSGPHVLDPFVFGDDPWAPRFYGLCRIEDPAGGEPKLYTAMENLLGAFSKPSQLDLKVGVTIEPDAWKLGTTKYVKQTLIDSVSPTSTERTRLAGYKVYNPGEGRFSGGPNKAMAPFMDVKRVFSNVFQYMGDDEKCELLQHYGRRLEEMALWWRRVGEHEIRTVAMSLLFAFEGAPGAGAEGDPGAEAEAAARPVLKFIDYAHFYPVTEDWPEDGVRTGLFSALWQLDDSLCDAARTELAGSRPMRDLNAEENKWKCARASVTFERVTEERCRHLAVVLGKRYLSWRNTATPECRLCNGIAARYHGLVGWGRYMAGSDWHTMEVLPEAEETKAVLPAAA